MIGAKKPLVCISITIGLATIGGCRTVDTPGGSLTDAPRIIAHRGASAYLPEHTHAAYALAIGQGADMIEPDVVLTRDGVLVCSHDLYISNTSAMERTYPGRARADGKFYVIDFDLDELRALAQPIGRNSEHGPGMTIVTLDEMITLVRRVSATLRPAREIEIIPEAKHPAFHRAAGLPIEPALVNALRARGYTGRRDGAIIQCFDLGSLRLMRHELGCDLRLVYLVGEMPDERTLDEVAGFADGIGPKRTLLTQTIGPRDPRTLAEHAHARGLAIYPYTFGPDENEVVAALRTPGVRGVFTDNPDMGVAARLRAEKGAR